MLYTDVKNRTINQSKLKKYLQKLTQIKKVAPPTNYKIK